MYFLFLLVLLQTTEHKIIQSDQQFQTKEECIAYVKKNADDMVKHFASNGIKIEGGACATEEEMKKATSAEGQDVNGTSYADHGN